MRKTKIQTIDEGVGAENPFEQPEKQSDDSKVKTFTMEAAPPDIVVEN